MTIQRLISIISVTSRHDAKIFRIFKNSDSVEDNFMALNYIGGMASFCQRHVPHLGTRKFADIMNYIGCARISKGLHIES